MTIEGPNDLEGTPHTQLTIVQKEVKRCLQRFSEMAERMDAGEFPSETDLRKQANLLSTAIQLAQKEGKRIDDYLEAAQAKERGLALNLTEAKSEILDRLDCLRRARSG